MVKNNLTAKQWNNIVNTYFTGYYMTNLSRDKRKNYRALYLSNIETLKTINPKFGYDHKVQKMIQYNRWYVQFYNKNVPLSKNNNIIPRKSNYL